MKIPVPDKGDREVARRRLRANAQQLGVLAEPHVPRRTISRAERQAAIDSARGLGEVVDSFLEDGR